MFNFISSIFRLIIVFPGIIRIMIVLISSGAVFNREERGQKLAIAFKKLGPSFIKLGQTLSVRPDLVGEEIADSLTSLQDKIPPFPSDKAIAIIEQELSRPLKEMFSEFDENAIAAASIAQVHKAKTIDGHVVAVKILRPGIEKKFQRDISLFYSIAKLCKTIKKFRRLRPKAVVDVLADSVKKELDLRMEAAAASELKENCINDEGIYVPNVYWRLTSQKVLVTEWIDGVPVNDRDALVAAGHSLEKITERLSIAFLNQSYRDGFFHADIHPGNLFVNKDGNIVPVDFGIMGRLEHQTRIYVAEILRGFLSRDYAHVAKIHFDAGYVPKHKSELDFMLACRAIGEPIMGLPVAEISIAKLLAMLFKVTEDFEMETQPQLLLLQKTMVLIEGVGQKLYPEVNMWHQAEDWITGWAKDNISIHAKIRDGAKDLASMISELPDKIKKLDKILDKIAVD